MEIDVAQESFLLNQFSYSQLPLLIPLPFSCPAVVVHAHERIPNLTERDLRASFFNSLK